MTANEIIYDIRMILNSLSIEDDLSDDHIIYKVNSYRGLIIQQDYARSNMVNDSWIQTYGIVTTEAIDIIQTDPTDALTVIQGSQVQVPSILDLPGRAGLYRVGSPLSYVAYDPVSEHDFLWKVQLNSENGTEERYCTLVGSLLKVYPRLTDTDLILRLILSNPMEGKIFDTGLDTYRTLDYNDPYPLDIGIAQRAVMEVLTKDFQIKQQTIGDVINDGATDLKVMKVQGNGQRSSAGN